MKTLIIISGPMGIGKTVTGKRLCDKIGKAAFIDGDWCLDIHPFVGNKETKNMAIDNIIHLIKNYNKCTECNYIVFSWIMSRNTITKIVEGLNENELKIYHITLICKEETLIKRWKNDKETEWRNEEWLKESIKSIAEFINRNDFSIMIHNDNKNINEVVNNIIMEIGIK
jgi:hypothetical protein